ncbi:hypothetical protein CASFOL_038574 [Castilleja foliolosa]|uniref:Phosphatase n=1 Tax=Castilleja foliolosa TaxID=1961234 RepID=A0ABD3BLC6_9LAMI
MAGIMVIFDFDKTIIDLDSDNWVVDELGFTELFDQLLPTMPWNSLMMMKVVHAQGKTIEDIKEVLRRVAIHPMMVPTIKKAHALGCDMRILSDANIFFIETILDHLGIKDCFSEINSNPSFVDEDGRLRISPYVDFLKFPHGCKLCPPNMCKGKIVERIQASFSPESKKKMIYLGDGAGDFCPSLRLKEGDYMMPRKNFPVWDLICENRSLLEADIHGWADGEELKQILLKLINKMSNLNTVQISSIDCKFETIHVNGNEPCPHHLEFISKSIL